MLTPRSFPMNRLFLLVVPLAKMLAGCVDQPLPTEAPIDGPSFLQVPIANNFIQLESGANLTCALRSDGMVECWGNNDAARAPALRAPSHGTFTQVTSGTHACALRSDGVVECWGDNTNGKAPATRTATSGSFTSVSAGVTHTCALNTAGAVECWESNVDGQSPARRTAGAGSFIQAPRCLKWVSGLGTFLQA